MGLVGRRRPGGARDRWCCRRTCTSVRCSGRHGSCRVLRGGDRVHEELCGAGEHLVRSKGVTDDGSGRPEDNGDLDGAAGRWPHRVLRPVGGCRGAGRPGGYDDSCGAEAGDGQQCEGTGGGDAQSAAAASGHGGIRSRWRSGARAPEGVGPKRPVRVAGRSSGRRHQAGGWWRVHRRPPGKGVEVTGSLLLPQLLTKGSVGGQRAVGADSGEHVGDGGDAVGGAGRVGEETDVGLVLNGVP